MQSQSNELMVTKDSTTNGFFVDILIFSYKGIFEGFIWQRVLKNIYNSPNRLHYLCYLFIINMKILKMYKFARFYVLFRKMIIILNYAKI